jgi:CheY-like chemotaxis protein
MSADAGGRPAEILMVEDNAGDVVLVREALREGPPHVNLSIAVNGEEALARLRRHGPFANAPRPDLILLDLNLPRLGGREVLAAIKSDTDLRRIPVVILTSSEAEQDIAGSYDLHANCYVTKPANLDELIRVVRLVQEFWLTVVKLPRGEP